MVVAARIGVGRTVAAADIAALRIAEAVLVAGTAAEVEPETGVDPEENPARRAVAGHIPVEAAVAMDRVEIRDRHTQGGAAAEALPPRKPRPPSPVRRRKGSLSSREERRVRIADISS